jgi:hypothetical protein
MSSRQAPRLTLSVKIDAATVTKARQLARDYSGKPHFLRLNQIVESSLNRFIAEFERTHGDDAEPSRDKPNRNTSNR